MLDIQALRDDPQPVIKSIKQRHQDEKLALVDEALSVDEEWRAAKGALDEKRAARNRLSEQINATKKEGGDIKPLVAQAKTLPGEIKTLEENEERLRERLDKILKTLPSPLHPDVPEGEGEEDNVVREEWGGKPTPDFEPKSHVELAEQLGIADFDAARRTSGSGFFFLKGDLALLDRALQQFALDAMLKEGFEPVVPPYLVRREIVDGMVDLAFFEEIMFKLEGKDLYPIPTSEFPLVGMLSGQDIELRALPVKLCGISPCFRAEVGAHGIDEKGLFRTHQFEKIEQVVVCKPQESRDWHQRLIDITKRIFTDLELPWRVLEMCAADLGDLKERQYDLEVWSPRRNAYFEVASCSNLTDFQARRLGIRMMHPDGEREYAHTLNNTAIATSRAMVAILENHQQADGTVRIPQKLQPYMGGKTIIGSA